MDEFVRHSKHQGRIQAEVDRLEDDDIVVIFKALNEGGGRETEVGLYFLGVIAEHIGSSALREIVENCRKIVDPELDLEEIRAVEITLN